jgi:hypothetical protein
VRTKSTKSKVNKSPALTYLLTFVVVFEVLVSVWAFVHFGAGTSRIAVDRFQPFGAEILMAITAATAGFAWFTVFRKRWAAYGLFSGLGMSLLWVLASPIKTDGLNGPDGVEALPSWPIPAAMAITLISGVALLYLVSREWRGFERR